MRQSRENSLLETLATFKEGIAMSMQTFLEASADQFALPSDPTSGSVASMKIHRAISFGSDHVFLLVTDEIT